MVVGTWVLVVHSWVAFGEEGLRSLVWVLHKLAWVHYSFVDLVEGHILEWVS